MKYGLIYKGIYIGQLVYRRLHMVASVLIDLTSMDKNLDNFDELKNMNIKYDYKYIDLPYLKVISPTYLHLYSTKVFLQAQCN